MDDYKERQLFGYGLENVSLRHDVWRLEHQLRKERRRKSGFAWLFVFTWLGFLLQQFI